MNKIQLLPLLVANQIAAGEVIDRPASIVKELLENALDAKATVINIDIYYGGLNQIIVSDNGLGINAEDLPLAIAPHATSKIQQLNDLYCLESLGFRGEALASISSVAKLTIASKPAFQEHAAKILCENQNITVNPCARSQGTTVEVADIFFNAPIRKKFLKSAATEFQMIEQTVKRIAFCSDNTAIRLTHNNKLCLNLMPAVCENTKRERIRKLLGKNFIDQAIFIDESHHRMQLQGWISNKHFQRSQNDKQWIYVNNRTVKDKLLQHAVRRAYENLLYPGRHHGCLLYFNLPTNEVDVNVHPTKNELRFINSRDVHNFVFSKIQTKLYQGVINDYASFKSHSYQVQEPKKLISFKKDLLISVPNLSACYDLNTDYFIYFFKHQPFLINLMKLYKYWLEVKLSSQSFPLPSRTILTPILYMPNIPVLQFIEFYQQKLAYLGIEVSAQQKQIMIHRVPELLPYLDLKALLQGLSYQATQFTENALLPTNQALLTQLLDYQCLNKETIWVYEKPQLTDFLATIDCDKVIYRSFCRPLSPENCRKIFDE